MSKISPYYMHGMVHCPCGHSFYAGLEDELVQELASDSFDNQIEDTQSVECPSCSLRMDLRLQLQKDIYVQYSHVSISDALFLENGDVIPSEFLASKWIGDQAIYYAGQNQEVERIIPSGTYLIDQKEFVVKDGFINQVWSMPDQNQLSLFEECIS